MDIELYALLNRAFGFVKYKPLSKPIDEIISNYKNDIYEYILLTGGYSFGYKNFYFYDINQIISMYMNNSNHYIIGDYNYNGKYIYILANKNCDEYYFYNGRFDNDFEINDLNNNIGTTFNSLYMLFDTIINKKVKERDFYS
jgi:hypothetical protein